MICIRILFSFQYEVEDACAYFISNYDDICARIAEKPEVLPDLARALKRARMVTGSNTRASLNTEGLDPYTRVALLMEHMRTRCKHPAGPDIHSYILKLIAIFRACGLNQIGSELEASMLHEC